MQTEVYLAWPAIVCRQITNCFHKLCHGRQRLFFKINLFLLKAFLTKHIATQVSRLYLPPRLSPIVVRTTLRLAVYSGTSLTSQRLHVQSTSSEDCRRAWKRAVWRASDLWQNWSPHGDCNACCIHFVFNIRHMSVHLYLIIICLAGIVIIYEQCERLTVVNFTRRTVKSFVRTVTDYLLTNVRAAAV